MTRTEFAKALDILLAERVQEKARIDTEKAVSRERSVIITCIRSMAPEFDRNYNRDDAVRDAVERIIAMIRNRPAWQQPDMFPKEEG